LRFLEFGQHAVQLLLRLGHGGIQGGELLFVGSAGYDHAVFALADDGFLDVCKKGTESIEVAGRDGIEFVIMTLATTCRLTHPCSTDGTHTICQHAGFIVLRLRTAFFSGKQQAIEGGADAGLLIGIRHEVASDLLDGEAIKGLLSLKDLMT
jgi:hypothetical protein